MYPKSYFDLFQPRDLIDEVFILCAFDDETKKYCDEIICPAIENGKYGLALKPYRVDYSVSSESITVEILHHIINSRLIFCDLSPIGHLLENNKKVIRNSNVMYELGLVHARRMPEEIIAISTDLSNLPFDTSNLRVHEYDRNDVLRSIEKISKIIYEQIRNIDLTKSEFVKRVVKQLDYGCIGIIRKAMRSGGDKQFTYDTLTKGEKAIKDKSFLINGLNRSLDLGLIGSIYNEKMDIHFFYWTEFGKAVIDFVYSEDGHFIDFIGETINKSSSP